METEKVGLFEAIYTQRAIRSLKPEPIPDDVLAKIVEAGTKAPSGGNSQPWAFVIVKDQKSISKIAGFVDNHIQSILFVRLFCSNR